MNEKFFVVTEREREIEKKVVQQQWLKGEKCYVYKKINKEGVQK